MDVHELIRVFFERRKSEGTFAVCLYVDGKQKRRFGFTK